MSLWRKSVYGVLSCQEGARVPGEDRLGLIHPACGERGRGPCWEAAAGVSLAAGVQSGGTAWPRAGPDPHLDPASLRSLGLPQGHRAGRAPFPWAAAPGFPESLAPGQACLPLRASGKACEESGQAASPLGARAVAEGGGSRWSLPQSRARGGQGGCPECQGPTASPLYLPGHSGRDPLPGAHFTGRALVGPGTDYPWLRLQSPWFDGLVASQRGPARPSPTPWRVRSIAPSSLPSLPQSHWSPPAECR